MILAADVNVVVSSPTVPNFTAITPAGLNVNLVPVAGPAGPTGPPGPGGGDWVSDAAPLETPDQARTTFTTPDSYIAGTLRVYLNGLRERFVTETSPTTFAFEDAPWAADTIRVDYLPTP